MALISCPECNAKVSDKASSCIQCGYPLLKAALELTDKLGRTVTFSDQVVIFPCILSDFDRPLWITNAGSGYTSSNISYYDWINRGDVIETIHARDRSPSLFNFPKDTPIRLISPVSGIILNSKPGYASDPSNGELHNCVKILLPKNEVIPNNFALVFFQELLEFCKTHPNVFLKPSEPECKLTELELANAIKKQANATVRIMSITIDFPECFEQIKQLRPNRLS